MERETVGGLACRRAGWGQMEHTCRQTNQNIVLAAQPADLVAAAARHVVAAAVLLNAVVAAGARLCVHVRPHTGPEPLECIWAAYGTPLSNMSQLVVETELLGAVLATHFSLTRLAEHNFGARGALTRMLIL